MRSGKEIYVEVARRAALILGGADALALYVAVPLVRVEYWLAGSLTPPDDVFLQLVDLVMQDQPVQVSRDA